jgi:hypothetical protein
MQSIADIFSGEISPDDGVGSKLKIDSIAVACNGIFYDLHTVAMPAMNTVSGLLLFCFKSLQPVVFDNTIGCRLRVNAEKIIRQDIIYNYDITGIINFNAGRILQYRLAGMLYLKSIYRNTLAFHSNYFVPVFTVEHRMINPFQDNRFINYKILFEVGAGHYEHRIPGRTPFNSLLNRYAGFTYLPCF